MISVDTLVNPGFQITHWTIDWLKHPRDEDFKKNISVFFWECSKFRCYCWWKKSWTNLYIQNSVNNGDKLLIGAGFLPPNSMFIVCSKGTFEMEVDSSGAATAPAAPGAGEGNAPWRWEFWALKINAWKMKFLFEMVPLFKGNSWIFEGKSICPTWRVGPQFVSE